MNGYPRFALYYAPAPGSDLDRFGAQLLGYDAYSGKEIPFPEQVMLDAPDWRKLTSDPRKYGFHATLKAPISLARGRTEAELVSACEAFAATPRAIPVIRPIVGSIEGFIAVMPAEPPPELIRLAADSVREFDLFRAPLTDADRARRKPSKLTPRQRENLECWGYPYVMDDFRFHMTLTGPLGADHRDALLMMLAKRFSGLRLATLPVDRIAVFRQANPASGFRIINHWTLSASKT